MTSDDRHELLKSRARELAPDLVGLTPADATARADARELTIRYAPEGQPVTASFGIGRITAVTRAGRIVQAAAG